MVLHDLNKNTKKSFYHLTCKFLLGKKKIWAEKNVIDL